MVVKKGRLLKYIVVFIAILQMFVGGTQALADAGSGDSGNIAYSDIEQSDETRFFDQKTSDGYILQYQILESARNTWWNVTGVKGALTVVRLDDQKEVARKTYALSPEGQVTILFKDFYSTDKKFPKNSKLTVHLSELDGEVVGEATNTIAMTQEDWDILQTNLKGSHATEKKSSASQAKSEAKSSTNSAEKSEVARPKQVKPQSSVMKTMLKILLIIGVVAIIGFIIFRLVLAQRYKQQLKVELEEQIRARLAERNKN